MIAFIYVYVLFCMGFCLAAQEDDKWTFWDVVLTILSPIWLPFSLGVLIFKALNYDGKASDQSPEKGE